MWAFKRTGNPQGRRLNRSPAIAGHLPLICVVRSSAGFDSLCSKAARARSVYSSSEIESRQFESFEAILRVLCSQYDKVIWLGSSTKPSHQVEVKDFYHIPSDVDTRGFSIRMQRRWVQGPTHEGFANTELRDEGLRMNVRRGRRTTNRPNSASSASGYLPVFPDPGRKHQTDEII